MKLKHKERKEDFLNDIGIKEIAMLGMLTVVAQNLKAWSWNATMKTQNSCPFLQLLQSQYFCLALE